MLGRLAVAKPVDGPDAGQSTVSLNSGTPGFCEGGGNQREMAYHWLWWWWW